MEVKLVFLRKGLGGDIWGLVGPDGMVVRQYPARTIEDALEFFISQSDTLKSSDGVDSIYVDGKVVTL